MIDDLSPASGKEAQRPAPAQESDEGFRADLPLAILESVRDHDRPTEVLEDEDLTASLPRRLGLTGVVESQIHRYRLARKRRERIPFEDVLDLLRLVMRRPDCEPILREAGHDLARRHSHTLRHRLYSAGRLLPDPVASRITTRSLKRLLRRIGGAEFRVTRKPLQVSSNRPITALADRYGIACILYAAAAEEAVQHVRGRRPTVEHTACVARGDEACVWTLG